MPMTSTHGYKWTMEKTEEGKLASLSVVEIFHRWPEAKSAEVGAARISREAGKAL